MNQGRFPPRGGSGGTITYAEPVGLRQRKVCSETANDLPHVYDNWQADVLRMCLPRDYDEERRLLYVAITRAESHVIFAAGENPNTFLEAVPVEITAVDAVTTVRTGQPKHQLLEYVTDHNIALIVMGTHGRNRFRQGLAREHRGGTDRALRSAGADRERQRRVSSAVAQTGLLPLSRSMSHRGRVFREDVMRSASGPSSTMTSSTPRERTARHRNRCGHVGNSQTKRHISTTFSRTPSSRRVPNRC